MNARRRSALVVAAPLAAVATFMIGLRVGAGNEFHAGLVYVARPGKAVGEHAPYAWQLVTYLEDQGVRETISMHGLTATARTVDGQESRWSGETNADGVAELHFDLPKATKIGLEIRAAGEKEPLALGLVDMTTLPVPEHPTLDRNWSLRPSLREGAPVDVLIEGERLVVNQPTPVWIRVGEPARSAHLAPDVGVNFVVDDVKPLCGPWASVNAVAFGQAASTLIEAKDADGKVVGKWFGTLPTAPGAFEIQVSGEELAFVAPNPRETVYVEVDDEVGRAFAAALPLRVEPGDPLPHARWQLPAKLAPGVHWVVASGDPRGAEKMTGATIARPFLVGEHAPGCAVAADLARRPAVGFPRKLAIDGIATRGAKNRARKRQGLFIGLVALAAAAILEVLLLTQASREARQVLALADNEDAERVTTKSPGGGLVVALLVAVLGFALLAALTVAKA